MGTINTKKVKAESYKLLSDEYPSIGKNNVRFCFDNVGTLCDMVGNCTLDDTLDVVEYIINNPTTYYYDCLSYGGIIKDILEIIIIVAYIDDDIEHHRHISHVDVDDVEKRLSKYGSIKITREWGKLYFNLKLNNKILV